VFGQIIKQITVNCYKISCAL